MKPLHYLIAICLFGGAHLFSQVLEIEHTKILVDTIPFRFTSAVSSKSYSRYREIRIGCLNTGRNDLLFTGASQSFTNDTSWLKSADNVKFPNVIKAGSYGTIVITYSVASPFQRIRITSNSKTGPQVITIIDTYREPLSIKRNMSDYPARLHEGDLATFSSVMINNSEKNIVVDSVIFPDPSLQMKTKLPLMIPAGKEAPLSLSANTQGKMNFYYGGTPLFFYHEENSYENFAKQEFSCIIVPYIQLLDKDTFDFGSVKRGTIVKHTFHYINKGSFPLEPGKNKANCLSYDKETVGPGENFSVTIEFNTAVADSGKKMFREFAVLLPPFFYSNSVYMQGTVTGPAADKSEFLQTDDRVIVCADVTNDTARSVKRKIQVKNNSGLPLTITNVTVGEGAYAFSDVKSEIPPGGTFNIKFVYPTKNPGYFDKLIVIAYTTGDCSNGEFFYQIEIKGNIIVR